MDIYICNTAYQVIVSIQMSLTLEKESKPVLIITDVVKNAETISKYFNTTEKFKKALFAKTKDLDWKERNWFIPSKKKEYELFIRKLLGAELEQELDEGNNRVFVANLSGFPIVFAKYLFKRSKAAELDIFEDGLSSYSHIYESGINYRLCNKNLFKRIQYKLIPSILSKTSNYYLFYPDLLVWKPPFRVKQIPSISRDDDVLKTILNGAFKYDLLQDTYSEKAIFFEESYIEDGIEVNDVATVNTLLQIFGPENVLIKRHPRVKANRFSDSVVKFNIDTAVPWEIILLNKDMTGKYLVTMTSTAVINSLLLIDSGATAVFDYVNLENNAIDRIQYSIEIIKKLEHMLPNRIMKIDEIRTISDDRRSEID